MCSATISWKLLLAEHFLALRLRTIHCTPVDPGQAIQYIQGPVARMVRCSASVAAQVGRLASPQADALGGPFEKKVQDFFREVCVLSTTFSTPQYRVCMSCPILQLLYSDFGLQYIFKGACLHVGVQTSAVDHQELQAR